MAKRLHVALLAGERSGDVLGGALMQALKKRYPSVSFSGIGGQAMQEQGLHSLVAMERLSVMGLVEVVAHLPDLWRVRQVARKYWQVNPPDIFIGIDAPDFNLPMARFLRARGAFCVHYVSPSLWAWKEKRIEKIKGAVDLMLCLFAFETAIYAQHGVQAVAVGHSLRDKLASSVKNTGGDGCTLGIFAGSRRAEIARLLPIYLQAFAQLQERLPQVKAVVSVSEAHLYDLVAQCVQASGVSQVQLSLAPSAQLLAQCSLALVSSGTITLEAALLQTPMVVAYKVQALTAAIARRLLKIDRFALPNLLDHRDLVPEYIQENATADKISAALYALWSDEALQQAQREGFARIAQALPLDVADCAAQAVLTAYAQKVVR